MKITPNNITKLKKSEVFVFGSNLAGNHAGGAAKLAVEQFGAQMANPMGLQGQSFAIPTLDAEFKRRPIEDIKSDIDVLQAALKLYSKKHFLVTEIGCGIAGFTHSEIAPLFKGIFQSGAENISLPQSFIDLLQTVRGYKVTDSDMKCRGFQYELGKIFEHTGSLSVCNNGFHYCPVLADCFGYYSFTTDNRVFEIKDHGTPLTNGDKNCTNKIEFIRELSWLEVLELVNTGKGNTGIRNAGNYNAGSDNAGNRNAGYSNAGNYNAGYSNAGNYNAGSDNAGNRNAGYSNAGNYNAGNYNAGNRNAGNYNAGNRNAGNRNAGYSNAGYSNAGNYNAGSDNAGNRNAGYSNAGNYNAGNYNAGNRNAGYSNAGSDNAGAFNNLDNQPYMLFNKPSSWTYDDFINSSAYRYLSGIETTLYIPDYKMTDIEKEENPYYITTGGYMKHLPYKEAFANAWGNWSDSAKQSFKDLPNFDSAVFEDITGIAV